ncbi:hypothetical protein [Piscinibacter sp. XHJ-5]|uniref:hypothetical protein n=1 Tax=Piscinibacter sp. XHJ-5 TaxID=3037797 RepID=UPI002452D135|nr:hypothetical protein [Piscinibacter sp. XHJ-5]
MNAKQIAAVVALAFAGTAAFAVEATQDEAVPASTLSRVSVQQAAQPQASGAVVQNLGEATQFADVPAIRSRDEVRAEARAAARASRINTLYVGA